MGAECERARFRVFLRRNNQLAEGALSRCQSRWARPELRQQTHQQQLAQHSKGIHDATATSTPPSTGSDDTQSGSSSSANPEPPSMLIEYDVLPSAPTFLTLRYPPPPAPPPRLRVASSASSVVPSGWMVMVYRLPSRTNTPLTVTPGGAASRGLHPQPC